MLVKKLFECGVRIVEFGMILIAECGLWNGLK